MTATDTSTELAELRQEVRTLRAFVEAVAADQDFLGDYVDTISTMQDRMAELIARQSKILVRLMKRLRQIESLARR